MQASIEHELMALGGHTSCVVMRVSEGVPQKLVSLNAERVFPAASLAKVPILWTQDAAVYLHLLKRSCV